MKWVGRSGSGKVIDRRVSGGALSGIGIIILVIYTLISGDPRLLLTNLFNSGTTTAVTPQEEQISEFVSVVLNDTETIWTTVLREYDIAYDPVSLVLYKNNTQSDCGLASSNVGPFYCSLDETIYLDLAFFQELQNRFGAPGDFAMAYVIAHEVGHHVQNELGILDEFYRLRQQLNQSDANELSVRLELQADYLAGVYAFHVQDMGYLEAGDIEEALTAASAVGDDKIQMETQGQVYPDSFTHGTAQQRSRWLMKGFEAGDLSDMDTFSTTSLHN
jgi:uncharacterized protein